MARRTFFVFLVVCIFFSLTACSKNSEESGKVEVIFAASATTGSFYQFAVPCCEIVSKYSDSVKFTAVSTTGTKESFDLLAIGEVDAAGGPSIMEYYSYIGSGPWEGAANDNFSVAYVGYPDYVQIATTADSAINCLPDLEDKKISMNLKQSSGDLTGTLVFDTLGIDGYEPYYMDSGESLSALQEGRIDAMIIQGGLGSSVFMELAASRNGMKLVPFTAEEAELVAENSNGILVPRTIPGAYYEGIDEEVQTVGGSVPVCISNDVPEDTVYEIVKILDEHHEELANIVNNAAYSTPENTVKDWGNAAIPLHPGAVKYYTELGLIG